MKGTPRASRRAAGRIERIESDPRDPRIARILVEGAARPVATVGREVLLELSVREGSRWTAALAARVAAAKAQRQARTLALAMLARSSQNAHSLRRGLMRRKVEASVAEQAIATLRADRWIDEEAHAALRADRIAASRPGAGREHIAALLAQEGIPEALASREAQRVAGGTTAATEALRAARAAIQRRGRRSALSVAQSLVRKGFDTSIIAAAMRREGFECDVD